jgi:hypothetical protein
MLFIVYKTDTWHSYNSRDIIGVATTLSNVYKICKAQAKKEGVKLDREQLFNLSNIKQTQGYSGLLRAGRISI